MSTPKPKPSDQREDQTELPPKEDGPEPTLPGVAQPPEVETEEDEEGGDPEDEESEEDEADEDKPKAKRRGRPPKAKPEPEPEPPQATQLPAEPVPPGKVRYEVLATALVDLILEQTAEHNRESRFAVCRSAMMYALKLLPRQYVAKTKRAA